MSIHSFNNSAVTLPAYSGPGTDSIFTDHLNTSLPPHQSTPFFAETFTKVQNNAHVHGMTQQALVQRQQYEQQIQSLHSTITQLQAENTALLASRNSYQDAFQRLAGALCLESDNPESIPNALAPMIVSQARRPQTSLSAPQEEDFPLVRFWTQTKYKEWLKTPERLAPEYKDVAYPFLEDDKGRVFDKNSVTDITRKMYAVWQGFKFRGVAPVTWGIATDAVKKEFYAEVVRDHPVLAFCANNWKAEKIATDRYPSWKQTHLRDSAESSLKNSKRQVKKEEQAAESNHVNKRIKIDPALSSSEEISESTPSVISLESEHLTESSSSFPNDSDVEPASVVTNTNNPSPDSDIEPVHSAVIMSGPSPSAISEPLAQAEILTLSMSGTTNNTGNEPTSKSSVKQTTETAVTALPSLNLNTVKVNSTTRSPASIPLKNPLARLLKEKRVMKSGLPAEPEAESKEPPVPTTPAISSTDKLNDSESKTTPNLDPSNTVTVTAAASSITTAQPEGTSESDSWQPRNVRTGRTLCAYRWLKQVNPNGNNDTFTIYWKSISAARKKQYEEECANLVLTKEWVGFATKIINTLATGTMY